MIKQEQDDSPDYSEPEQTMEQNSLPISQEEESSPEMKDPYEVGENTTAEGKSITYKLPRYGKRSFFTLMFAVFLPCMGYSIWRYYPLNEPGKLLENILNSFLFSSYGWTLALSSMTGGWSPSAFQTGLIFCCAIQVGLVVFLRKYEKWTPKRAFTIAICVGMGSLFLVNILEYILWRNQSMVS